MSISCARCDREGQGTPDTLPEGWILQASTVAERTFPICDACASKDDARPAASGDPAGDQLRLLIERVERLEEEEKGIKDDKRDVYAEAKARGYDVRVMREIVKRRKMDGHALREFEGILETYKCALGME